MQEIFDQLIKSSNYKSRQLGIKKFNSENKYIKKGIALTPVKFGISFTTWHLNQAGALVHIYFNDGSVHVNTGAIEMGQGTYTKIAQLAANALGLPFNKIKVSATRTDKVPNTSASAASSTTDLNGAATLNAISKIKMNLASYVKRKYKIKGGEGIYKNVVKGYTSNSVHLLMGHVFVDGALLADIEGSERRLHIDVAYGVDKARLPQEPQYLALGHIHHPQEILGTPNGSAAYAGSILQLDFGEREQQKIVRIIDLEPGLPAKPRLIPLTSGKPLVELKGTPDEVLAKSEKNENKNAYIRAVLEVDAPEPGMAQKMRDSAAGIVDIRLDYDRIEENVSTVSLQDLKPEELFVRYYQEQHGTIPSDELLALFREILGEVVSTE